MAARHAAAASALRQQGGDYHIALQQNIVALRRFSASSANGVQFL
jgi:hypothetical protein